MSERRAHLEDNEEISALRHHGARVDLINWILPDLILLTIIGRSAIAVYLRLHPLVGILPPTLCSSERRGDR